MRRLFSFRIQHRNIKNFILLSKICSRCLLRNARNQINYTSKKSNLFQRFFVNSRSRFISNLQSIKTNRLFRTRKRRIREIFNNIRSRNRIASNSYFLFSTNDSKNRSFYYTKQRFFFVYQKYQAFRHTNRSIFLVANFQFVRFFHLFLEFISTFSFFRMLVAFATIFSNRTMICIDIYEQFISIMHFVMNLKSMRSNAIS